MTNSYLLITTICALKERGEVLWDSIIWRFNLDSEFGAALPPKVMLKLSSEE